jgi:NADPH:quinone reductase
VGIVEELGAGCTRLGVGDRVGVLTVWGANAERVCVPERYAVTVPEDLDPAEVVSLVFAYMTAYQLLHRAARARKGETILVHGAAGRVGSAILELGAIAGLRMFGTASKRDLPVVERLGAVAIDYQNDDFLARVRERTGDGVDVALDGLGGPLSLRSFRALRRGGRLVVFGRYATIAHGRKNWPAVFGWYASTAAVALWGLLSPSRRVLSYRVQVLRTHHQDWFDEDFRALLGLLREREIHPAVAARLQLSEARRAHELLESTASTGKIVFVS